MLSRYRELPAHLERFIKEESSQRAPPFFVDGGSINQTRLEGKNRAMAMARFLCKQFQANKLSELLINLSSQSLHLMGATLPTLLRAVHPGTIEMTDFRQRHTVEVALPATPPAVSSGESATLRLPLSIINDSRGPV